MSDASDCRERWMAEETLRENDKQLRLLVEDMGAIISRHLPDSTFTFVSPSCQALTGYAPEDLVHTPANEYVHSDDLKTVEATIRDAVEKHNEHYRIQHGLRCKDGNFIWVETVGRLLYTDDGLLHEIQCVTRNITEQKQLGEALRESDARLRQVAETLQDVCWITDWHSQKTLFASRAYESIWGRSLENLYADARDWTDAIHPDDRRRVCERFGRLGEGGPYDEEYRIVRPDGTIRWIRDRGLPVHDADGQAHRVVGIAQDITEKKQVEDQLRVSEATYRTIFDSGYDAVFFHDIDTGAILDVNQRMCEIFGYTREEALKLDVGHLSLGEPPYTLQEAREWVRKATTKGPQTFEWISRRKNGEKFWVEVTLKQAVIAGEERVLASARDITERKQVEQELRQERDRAQKYLDIAGVMFVACDAAGNVSLINQKGCEVLGYEHEEVIGKNWCDNFLPENVRNRARAISDSVMAGDVALVEYDENTVLTKSGEERLIAWHNTALEDDEGRIVGALCSGEDITQRKHAEREREKLIARLEAQNAELERFAYTVSHDLKSPLITIKGFVGTLRQELEKKSLERAEDDLARISDAADKMDYLLRDLLELSRIGRLAAPSENVSLEQLAREACSLVDSQTKVGRAKIEIVSGLPVVYGDRIRLLEVFQNLIENAVKYMGDESQPRIEIGVRSDGNETVCYVRDNGIGIESCYHDKVFGLFNQLDAQVDGTGIGLALVKRIVETHQGRVWIESAGMGHGSTFCFTLPVKNESSKLGKT